MRRLILALSFLFCTICTAGALAGPFALHVSSDIDRKNSPAFAELAVPAEITMDEVKAYGGGGFVLMPGNIPLQAEAIKNEKGAVTRVKLYWIEPELTVGKTKVYRIDVPAESVPRAAFKFTEGENYRDLSLGSTPVWRHDQLKYDPAKHTPTFKHFHQVYGFHGDGFITQGNDGKQFPHHRGLYIGWNKTSAGGKSYDTWHCTGGVALRHRAFVAERELAGHVVARATSLADWTAGDGKAIVMEERTLTTWNLGAGAVALDFDIKLTSAGGEVKLEGDPQHAGFQFRAHGDVGNTKAKYVYPKTAKGKGGDVWEGCAWVTNTFKIKNHAYAVAYLDHPENPGTKEGKTVFSTRDYGRFGAFAPQILKEGSPLVFRYRVIVVDAEKHGDLSQGHFDAQHAAFVKPVSVKLGAPGGPG